MFSAQVYCGGSRRIDNGTQAGMPVFGRFAAVLATQTIRVVESRSGFYVSLPGGCTLGGGEWTEEEANEAGERVANHGWNGWTTDREAAIASAINEARGRHEAKCLESAAYAAKFRS